MKIGFITSSLSSGDGIGRYSKSLIEAISNFAEVTVLTSKETKNETFLGRVFKVLPPPSFNLLGQLRVFYHAMRYLKGCDVVHVLTEPFCIGASFASRISGFKLIITLHGTYAIPPLGYRPRQLIKRALMKFAYHASPITTTGSYNTERKVREIVSDLGECRFIPNGVDDKIFHTVAVERPAEPFIMTVGEVKARKGADVCVAALGLLKNEFPGLRYKIIGEVDDGNPYTVSLKNMIEQLGLKNRIDFMGRIGDDLLVGLYNQCILFVLAAKDDNGNFEGFPMVYFEANACGTPVITTKGFGSEYAIKDGVNGFLIEPNNPIELAAAIKKVISDDNLAKKLRENALIIAKNHTWQKIAESSLIKMYQDALNR